MTAPLELSEGSTEAEFADVLVGHRVIAAQEGSYDVPGRAWSKASGLLTLDDGTKLYVIPNEGCSCGAGDYDLTKLAKVDNIITAVRTVDEATGDGASGYDSETGEYTAGRYAIYVIADAEEINLVEVTGDDGNGYYGTGFTITVVKP